MPVNLRRTLDDQPAVAYLTTKRRNGAWLPKAYGRCHEGCGHHSDQVYLIGIGAAIMVSRLTMRTIKQNLFWAFGYNVLGVPAAVF